ncbi:SDR family oxidoreductase [Nocardia sp. NPDC005978]|uniref:SDR family NAD(P)-dependent oxidoreductase n=1 Tax=Nocardia sp. NPDC005978 TaxID=3156725 RepID=UPI0033BA531B
MGLLDDKVIIISGASRGIGAAAARLFAAEGARLVLGARTEAPLRRVADLVRESGGVAVPVIADVTTRLGADALVEAALDAFGSLDGGFYSAGIGRPDAGRLIDLDEKVWDEIHDLNLRGAWLSLAAQIPRLARSGGGAIVIASSVGGLVGGFSDGAYQASKHGLDGLVKAATADHAAQGIRVNAIAPGVTTTDDVRAMLDTVPDVAAAALRAIPANRFAEPAEVAEAAAWLLSDRAAYIAGVTLPIDGGMVAVRM